MAGRKSDFTLPTNTLDDLFSTQEERDEAKLQKIRDIPLSEIDGFPNHPFQVREDEDMFQLVESIKETVAEIKAAGGEASYIVTDVAKKDDVFAMAKFAVDTYGRIDVLVNNAGTMPLAFFSEHEQALDKWEQCIDISIKGTIFGISAVYDQMIKQGQGQVINVSSIYANFPVAGAGVYQVAKMGVQYLAESLRSECQGKIKVTTIKPTGFMKTNLSSSVVDQMAMMPAVAGPLEILSNWVEEAPLRPDFHDINSMTYNDPDPQVLADNIIYAINQPWGVSIGDLTVRASGESFVI